MLTILKLALHSNVYYDLCYRGGSSGNLLTLVLF